MDYQKRIFLRSIIREYDSVTVGKLFLELLEYKKLHLSINDNEKDLFLKCVNISNKMIGKNTLTKEKPATGSQKKNLILMRVINLL